MIFFDSENSGFYDDSIHVKIPSTAIEITTEAYDFFLKNSGKYEIDLNNIKNKKIINKSMLKEKKVDLIIPQMSELDRFMVEIATILAEMQAKN